MSKTRSIFFVVFIIVVIAVTSCTIPVVYSSESNNDVEEFTPVASKTPTPSITPSLTFTQQKDPTLPPSPTLEVNTNCVYPTVYWKDHPELWLELLVGNTMYSKDDIRLILDDSSQEIHRIFLKQLYLANLNILSGADPTDIDDILAEANIWLQEYFPDKKPALDAHLLGIQMAQKLIDFNAGLIGPGFCAPYETFTETPIFLKIPATFTLTPSLTPTSTATIVVTRRPVATATKTEKPDSKPEPTDPPKPTKEPATPEPPPPEPTEEPTDAPEEPTDVPTSAP